MKNENTTRVVFITDKTGQEIFKEFIHKDFVNSAIKNILICTNF